MCALNMRILTICTDGPKQRSIWNGYSQDNLDQLFIDIELFKAAAGAKQCVNKEQLVNYHLDALNKLKSL